ncbi:MarR family winged helix-turn-helix transcriptional regulator [Streptomyces bauhiniae]|uniref:MarR family winged helix-turn-helix transcriptional regulator n=1 Tax=Streptomyces bauhiniae TaxID=2340725 RepID=UPI00362F02D8
MRERATSVDPAVSGVPPEDLMIAVEQLVRYVRRSATAGDLSATASTALGRLGREGPQRLTVLARSEGVSQPNMTQLVNRMERGGLVQRVADPSDGRVVLVEATEAGLQIFRQRHAERARALQQLIEELAEPEQRAVKVALPALARAIQDLRPPS